MVLVVVSPFIRHQRHLLCMFCKSDFPRLSKHGTVVVSLARKYSFHQFPTCLATFNNASPFTPHGIWLTALKDHSTLYLFDDVDWHYQKYFRLELGLSLHSCRFHFLLNPKFRFFLRKSSACKTTRRLSGFSEKLRFLPDCSYR